MNMIYPSHPNLDRIYRPSKEAFNSNYGYKSLPVVLTGLMDDWYLKSKWTDDFFVRNMGDIEEYASRCVDKNDKIKIKVSDYFYYMNHLSDVDPYYLKNCQFHLRTEMTKDYIVPEYFKSCLQYVASSLPIEFQLSWLYIGARGTFSGLHLDLYNTSAWNAVISGKKKWLFYPPSQARYLYNGQVNPFDPDYAKFPEFIRAEPMTAVQNPGEIVFTPSGWWHAVYNVEQGVSLTENFINEINYERVKSTLSYHQKFKELQVIETCMNHYLNMNS